MKILITGVSGYIGQTIIKNIEDAYSEIIGLDKVSIDKGNSKLDRFIACDLGNKSDMDLLIGQDIDVIIHLAGEADVQATKQLHYRNNILGSLNLLDYAVRKQVKKIIFLSSNKAGNSSHYGKAKQTVETEIINLAKAGEIKYTILRSAIVYGPGMRSSIANWIRLTGRKLFPALPASHSVIEMISVGDLCKAIELCISNNNTDNKIYDISDGYPYNVNEIELKSRAFFHSQLPLFTAPKAALYLLSKMGDLLGYIGIKLPMNTGSYQMLFENQRCVNRSFERDTGFQPSQHFFDELPQIFQRQ